MRLQRIGIGLVLLAGLAGALTAAEVDGVLMDQRCSIKAVKGGQQAAAMHTRECAMMPPCEKSGYGVFTADNKFIALDAGGNSQAVAALKASGKKDNLKVKVTGTISGDTIAVSSLRLE